MYCHSLEKKILLGVNYSAVVSNWIPAFGGMTCLFFSERLLRTNLIRDLLNYATASGFSCQVRGLTKQRFQEFLMFLLVLYDQQGDAK